LAPRKIHNGTFLSFTLCHSLSKHRSLLLYIILNICMYYKYTFFLFSMAICFAVNNLFNTNSWKPFLHKIISTYHININCVNIHCFFNAKSYWLDTSAFLMRGCGKFRKFSLRLFKYNFYMHKFTPFLFSNKSRRNCLEDHNNCILP